MQSFGENTINHLDDDTGELDYLRKQLKRMDGLSDELIGILDGFEGRLVRLEASIKPIHSSTQNLTKLASNIDRALTTTDDIVNCLNLPSKEETFILKGPDEKNVLPYLQTMGALKDAVDTVERNQLRSCEKTVNQMKQLLKAGMLHLETLFRTWLSSVSHPVDAIVMLDPNRDPLSTGSLKELSQLSTYISTSEKEIGYAVDFTKPYIEIRSAYLVKSLHGLSQSVQLSERHQGISYEKGSGEFLKYIECFVKMVQEEQNFAKRILGNPTQRLAALKGSIAPAMQELVSAGRQLNAVARRLSYYDTIFIFDVMDKYERDCAPAFKEVSKEIDLSDCTEMMSAFKVTALKSFYDFMEDVKGKKENNAFTNMSSDGTVHEMTSNTLNYLKRLYLWRDIVEPLLIILGDGGWSHPVSLSNIPEQQNPYGESTKGFALLQSFFCDALDQLTLSIQSRSRGYKKPTLATVFLLNNYNHILRQIRTPPLNAIFDDASEMKYSKLVKKQIDSYQDSWKPCVENLMDVTYVRSGTIKNAMGSGDRQLIKERFKSFNTEFEEIWRAQTTYAVPDAELRAQVIRDVKNVLVPMYGRFLDK
ncbi:Cullin repeat-like-containing domain protein [Dichotomocladium elegans]|nr:Cullin repeat-like-containing domain protein [Dichotomocladium elegans]